MRQRERGRLVVERGGERGRVAGGRRERGREGERECPIPLLQGAQLVAAC